MTTVEARVRVGLRYSIAAATVTRRTVSPSRVTMLEENRSSMVSTSAVARAIASPTGVRSW